MRVVLSILFSAILFPLSGWASEHIEMPEVGPHERLLIIEKSENPQNLLAVFTKVDEQCRIVRESPGSVRPLIGYYWLMNRTTYKTVHPLILNQIQKRMTVVDTKGDVELELHDITELQHDLKNPHLEIKSRRSGAKCELEALLRLGPSDKEVVMRVTKLYTQSKRTMAPPFRRVVGVTLEGENAKTGAPMKRTYSGK